MGRAVRYSEETTDTDSEECRWTDRQINRHKLKQKTRAQSSARLLAPDFLADEEWTSMANHHLWNQQATQRGRVR